MSCNLTQVNPDNRGCDFRMLTRLAHSLRQSPNCNPSQTFIACSGHSLGGAMAVLAAYDIAELQPWASLQVYTVGAPRPGNRGFARQYNAKVPHTWHVINPQVRAAPTPHTRTDVVPAGGFVQLHESCSVCDQRLGTYYGACQTSIKNACQTFAS